MSDHRPRDQRDTALGSKSLKVTDRRMFTADGELREEFRQLDEVAERSAEASEASPPAVSSPAEPSPGAGPPATDGLADEVPEPAASGAPGFYDLVRLLAEHASVYLSEAHGGSAQAAARHLELARLHIDLLAVLKTKTQGNLASSEAAMLDDAIQQLNAGYVGVRG